MTSVISPLFSVPVYIGNVDITPEEKEHCSLLPKGEGGHYKFDITHHDRVIDHPMLSNIKNQAIKHLESYTKDVFAIDQEKVKFYINTSWASYMEYESVVRPHSHPHSLFTGVMVLDCTEDSKIYFNASSPSIPDLLQFKYTEYNPFNSKSWYFDMIPNQIYLFPSSIGHYAKCLQPGGQLSVLAFDTFISGTLGGHSCELTFK